MKLMTTDTTGKTLKTGQMMEQWGAVWIIVEAGEHNTLDGDVWLDLKWLGGSTDLGESMTVFYGLNESVTIVGFDFS